MRPHLEMFQETARSRGRDMMRNIETQIFERHVGVAAARGPPFFRDSLARPLLHARLVFVSFFPIHSVPHRPKIIVTYLVLVVPS